MTAGEKVRLYRESAGLSLTQLAEAANITKSGLHDIENKSNVRPSATVFYEIARVLGVTMEALLEKPLLADKHWLDEASQIEMRRLMDENRKLKHTLQRIQNIAGGTD